MKNDIHSLQWETIQLIVNESAKIKYYWRLKSLGYKCVFAPDFSEIHAYIAPSKDFSEGDFDRNLRRWYAIKALLDNTENINILLPPYMAELSQKVNAFRRRIGNPNTITSTIKQLFEDADFIKDLNELHNPIGDQADNFVLSTTLLERQGAKIGLLCELLSQHDEIELLQYLWRNDLIREPFEYILDIDDEEVVRNSVHWGIAIKKIRQEKCDSNDRILLSSHFDGWAVEYIRSANINAKKKPKHSNFIIFISRSNDIFKAVKQELDFRISDIGLFQPLWTPETYLVYHIIQTSPNKDISSIFKVIEGLYSFCKEYELKKTNPSPEVLAKVLETTQLSESIHNLILFKEKVNDDDFPRFVDVQKVQKYSSSKEMRKLITHTINYFITQDIRTIVESTSRKIDELWHRFGQGFPTIKVDSINKTPHVSIKYPGHRVWIRFTSKEIFEWINNTNTLNAIEMFDEHIVTLQSHGVKPDEVLLFKALKYMFLEDWEELIPVLESLGNNNDESIRKEAFLIGISVDILNKRSDPKIDLQTISTYETNQNDPRVLKVLSILLWRIWEVNHDRNILYTCVDYAKKAFNLVVEDENEFKVECQNNLAFYQMLLFEDKDPQALSLIQLINMYKDLRKISLRIYQDRGVPAEIYHTLGKLQIVWTMNDDHLSSKEKHDLLISGINDLYVALRSDRSQAIYISDFEYAQSCL